MVEYLFKDQDDKRQYKDSLLVCLKNEEPVNKNFHTVLTQYLVEKKKFLPCLNLPKRKVKLTHSLKRSIFRKMIS